MNKMQEREIEQAKLAIKRGMPDFAARSVSALIRSATSGKQRAALIQAAVDLQITAHPEFML
jgi:hypothetical protein